MRASHEKCMVSGRPCDPRTSWAGTWAAPGVQSAEPDLSSSIEHRSKTKSPLGPAPFFLLYSGSDLDGTDFKLGMLGTTHGHTGHLRVLSPQPLVQPLARSKYYFANQHCTATRRRTKRRRETDANSHQNGPGGILLTQLTLSTHEK